MWIDIEIVKLTERTLSSEEDREKG